MITERKLLILGGSHSEIPLISAGQSLGYTVTTSGNREADIGHDHADLVRLADFSDRDAMLDLAKDLKVSAICPGCNDFAALSAAYVAESLGLPGHDSFEVAEIIHHKDKFRALASKIGVSSPEAMGCSSIPEVEAALQKLDFPIIVKPVDLTGGKGIQIANDHTEALEVASQALKMSRAARIVLEKFIVGSRHGLSMLLKDRRVIFYFADDEQYHLSPYLVSGASAPSSCSPKSINNLIEQSEAIANELQLVDGIFHMQFIEAEPGNPVIIEICRRPPGDLYVDLVRLAAGIRYAELIVGSFCGESLPSKVTQGLSKFVTRHCLMSGNDGIFEGFDFDSRIASKIKSTMIWAKKGDEVGDSATHKFGIVFIDHGSLEDRNHELPELPHLLGAKVSDRQ